jgi:hypothetical protein
LIKGERRRPLPARLRFHPVLGNDLKRCFDSACQELHYAGACHRVGRLLRLVAMLDREWVGGIVLGSPFPNIRPRDDAFGISRFTRGLAQRGLSNAWGTENRDYWDRLQLIINHARAFVFPDFRGGGLGVEMHKLLETEGRAMWEEKYGPSVGFDTLCTDPFSRLFADNGWILVGRTKGYRRDPKRTLSRRVAEKKVRPVSDNAALTLDPNNYQWWVWVRVLSGVG